MRSVRNLIGAHPIASFVILAIGLSWIVQAAAFAAGLSLFVVSAVGSFGGLGIAAVLVTALEGGRPAVADLLARAFRWRVHPGWYLISGFGLFSGMLAASFIIHGLEPAAQFAQTWPAFVASMLVDLAVALVAIQLVEELAWTGFLQHRLQYRHGELRAALLVAPAFGLAHLVVNYLGAGAILPALVMVGIQIVFALFFRVVVARLYNAAGQSVIIAALFHAALNVANDDHTAAIVGKAEVDWLPLALIATAGSLIAAIHLIRRLHPMRHAAS